MITVRHLSRDEQDRTSRTRQWLCFLRAWKFFPRMRLNSPKDIDTGIR